MGVDTKSTDEEKVPVVDQTEPENTEAGTEEKPNEEEDGQAKTDTANENAEGGGDVEAATTKEGYQPLFARSPFLLRCLIALLIIFVILVLIALIVLIVVPAVKTYFHYVPSMHVAKVRVPQNLLYTPPFDRSPNLTVPKGFEIEAYARVTSARSILPLPKGDILVSQPKENKISLLRRSEWQDMAAITSDFATGLRSPNKMAFYTEKNGDTYIYVAEETQVARYSYVEGDTKLRSPQVIVSNLPYESDDQNPFKGIAIGNGSLYVSIGSHTDFNPNDLRKFPKRGAIYGYRPHGGQGRLVTEGVRSAEGLAFFPGTNDLWAVVKQRQSIRYPFKGDKYDQVDTEYVSYNPPEEFSRVVEGEHYGWPFCNPNYKISTETNVEYVPDVATNPEEAVMKCSKFRKIDLALPPHTVPTGLAFWSGENAPKMFKNGALIALNEYNRQTEEGNSVIFVPWDSKKPTYYYTLVKGWVLDAEANEKWGQPADVAVLEDGSVLISDEMHGAIYRLFKKD